MVTVIPDYTLLVQIVTFLLLVVALNFILYKPILAIIDRRKKQLEELENEVALFRAAVDKKVSEYDEKLKQAKTNAAELKKEIINEGADQAKQMVDAVRNEIPVMTQEFQQKMDKELGVARQVLQGQSRNLSLEIATKVLGRSVQ